MNPSIFAEKEFVLLIVVSIVLPIALYQYMMMKRALSRAAVLMLGKLRVRSEKWTRSE